MGMNSQGVPVAASRNALLLHRNHQPFTTEPRVRRRGTLNLGAAEPQAKMRREPVQRRVVVQQGVETGKAWIEIGRRGRHQRESFRLLKPEMEHDGAPDRRQVMDREAGD